MFFSLQFKDEALELEENDYKKSKERKVETDFVSI